MGIFNALRNELVDIIEWIDDSKRTLVYRFPRHMNDIKHGAKLIVRPGQVAIFVRQGVLADVFGPGTYELSTPSLPVLARLEGWKHGFVSPFRSEVYFVSTITLTDLKWGTPNPILLRDPDFGSVRLRAFGHYTLRAIDPRALIKELVGTDGIVEAEEVGELLRSIIISSFSDVIGEAKVAALDLASQYTELADAVRKRVCDRIDDEYGLQVPSLQILNIALPEAVEKAVDARGSMAAIGDMARYQQFQFATALPEVARNPAGGAAADALGLGMGFAMAQQAVHGMGNATAGAGMTPPPLPGTPQVLWHVAVHGQNLGAMSQEQLTAAIRQGQIQTQSLVWRAGMANWAPILEASELAVYFGPPPLR